MTKRKTYLYLVFIATLLLSACKSTHFVPEDKFMLNKNEVKIQGTYSFDPEEIKMYVKQKPNTSRFFGTWKFYLTAYNFLNKRKDETIEFQTQKHKLFTRLRLKSKDAIGEAPVILDTTKITYSIKQMQTYLQNKGYYHSQIQHEIKYAKNKKAKVIYNVILNDPFIINQIKAKSDDPFILSSYHQFAESSPLKQGNLFDAGTLNMERTRLTELYQNEGLFDFSEYFIHYQVDTTIGNNKVNITLLIDNPIVKYKESDSAVVSNHKRYKIRDIFIQTDYIPTNPNLPSTHSILTDSMYTFIYRETLNYKPTPLIKAIYFKRGDYYRIKNHNRTYTQLTELGIFNFIKIDYKRIISDSIPLMDITIKLAAKKKHSISFEGQATFREGFGGGGIVVFKTKNPFKGLEQIEINFRGFAESVKNTATNDRIIGTDIGPQISMRIPSLLFFPKLSKKLWVEAYPKTILSTYFNYQNRQEYRRWIYSFSNTYQINELAWKTHKLSLPEITLSYIDKNSAILNKLDTLSPRLAFSFQNYLNMGVKYSYIFNGQLKKEKNPSILMANINITGLAGSLLNYTGVFEKDSSGAQLVAGIRYSKFVKIDGDYRKYFNLKRKEEQMILRSYAGVAVPFGNGDIAVPFDKLFFSGGANGIRGWKVRTLGPGSSQDSTSTAIDKLGEIKLEFNAEYRFRINDMIKGAIFTDAGNVWRLKDSDEKAVFRTNRFYKEIAVAGGVGLRFDLSFLVARVDVGWPLHQPYSDNVWQFKFNEAEFNVGIGYPF
ncbi:MAG: BamA/TamA family outer membrane protein [Bacteroidetes bacterium]|nr:BamA/TamA family outer membrane protein [Bacteroidota bacterium]